MIRWQLCRILYTLANWWQPFMEPGTPSNLPTCPDREL